jgi:hypothetical protein
MANQTQDILGFPLAPRQAQVVAEPTVSHRAQITAKRPEEE